MASYFGKPGREENETLELLPTINLGDLSQAVLVLVQGADGWI